MNRLSFSYKNWLTWPVLILVAFCVWMCNTTETIKEGRLTLNLPDSLTVEYGKYDSLTISILDTNGIPLVVDAYKGTFRQGQKQITDIPLGDNPPESFHIEIRGYKNKVLIETLKITATPQGASAIISAVKTKSNPLSIRLSKPSLSLFAGGDTATLFATVLPDTADTRVIWSSSNALVASVQNGKIQTGVAGNAVITVKSYALASLVDSTVIQVMARTNPQDTVIIPPKDTTIIPPRDTTRPPLPALRVSVGPAQSVAFGAKVLFPISIEPDTLGIDSIVWDFEGDGILDGKSTFRQALVEKIYPSIKREYNAKFKVADKHGRFDSVLVRVRVGIGGPLILITSPKRDTTVSNPNFTVTYTLDSLAKSKAFVLVDGRNPLPIIETNAIGSDTVIVYVSLDSTPPVSPVFTVTDTLTSNKQPQWTWRSGGGGKGTYEVQLDSTPSFILIAEKFQSAAPLADGIHTLKLREVDSVGNWSKPISRRITVKSTGSPAPVFVLAQTTTSPTNSARPKWTWSSGGGNGTFKWSLNTTPATSGEDLSTTFTPSTILPDGSYTMTVQERDIVGNLSNPATHEIVIQTTGPLAPRVTGTAVLTRTTPSWSWTGTGRTGARFRIRLFKGTSVIPSDSVESVALTYTPSASLIAGSDNIAYTLRVMEQDALGNWGGDGNAVVTVDNVAPGNPVFSAQPPTIVNQADTRTSLQWTWTRTGAVTDTFVIRMNGREVARQTSNTYSLNTFPDSTYTLDVTEIDLAGNASTLVAATPVLVDKTGPATPAIPVSPTPTRDNTPTWTWASAGGNGQFRYRIANNGPPTGAETDINALTYTPLTGLGDGSWNFQVRERDAAGNWSAWSPISVVVLKAAQPLAPTVTRNAAISNAPRWSWSGTAGATFRYRWAGDVNYIGEGTGTSFAPTGSAVTDGARTVCVSERDVIGYGPEGACQTITVDRINPTFTVTSDTTAATMVTSINPTFSGTVSDANFSHVACQVGTGAPTNATVTGSNWSCSPNIADGDPVISITAYDLAGNSVLANRFTLHKRGRVVFVRKGAIGKMNGTSWTDAYANAGDVLHTDITFSSSTQLWIAKGTYGPGTGLSSLYFRNNLAIIGGFAGFEADTSARNFGNNPTIFETTESGVTTLTKYFSENVNNLFMSDIEIKTGYSGISITNVNKALFNRLTISGHTISYALIWVTNSHLLLSNSTIEANQVANGGIRAEQLSLVLLSNTKVINNSRGGRIMLSGSATVCADNSTVIEGNGAAEESELNVENGGNGEFQYDASVSINTLTIEGPSKQVSACPSL